MDRTGRDGWRKSSYSSANGGQCVETANIGLTVAVRDSAEPAGAKLSFPPDTWMKFLEQLKKG
jgi:hypothetical protein